MARIDHSCQVSIVAFHLKKQQMLFVHKANKKQERLTNNENQICPHTRTHAHTHAHTYAGAPRHSCAPARTHGRPAERTHARGHASRCVDMEKNGTLEFLLVA